MILTQGAISGPPIAHMDVVENHHGVPVPVPVCGRRRRTAVLSTRNRLVNASCQGGPVVTLAVLAQLHPAPGRCDLLERQRLAGWCRVQS